MNSIPVERTDGDISVVTAICPCIPGILPDLSPEILSSSDFAESGKSFGKEVRMDALTQFLDVGESLFAINNFPHVKFPVVELFLLRSIFLAHKHETSAPG